MEKRSIEDLKGGCSCHVKGNDPASQNHRSMSRPFCSCRGERQPLVFKNENNTKKEVMKFPCIKIRRPLLIHLLVNLFGISAWIGVNGIYVQLPLLVNSAPEGWSLPAYIVVLIQAANIGPAVYTLSKKFFPRHNESLWISGLLFTGSVAMGLMAFFYDRTTFINGTEYSTAFFILGFLTALVGCTSSVLFMPYMRSLKEIYLTSYFIGEGLSGVLPSAVALIQGVGGNPQCVNDTDGSMKQYFPPPRFPPRDYFLFVFAVIVISLIAFWLLEHLPLVQSERALPRKIVSNDSSENATPSLTDSSIGNKDETTVVNESDLGVPVAPDSRQANAFGSISSISEGYLYFLMASICFLGNGFLPGIQSYSCLPYGDEAYHLTVTLASAANPIACFLTLWTPLSGSKTINSLSIFILIGASYVMVLSLMSPTPPLQNTNLGVVITVSTWVLLMGFISYVKLTIATMFRRIPGPRALFRIGVVMQAGSACGAILSFVLMANTSLFTSYNPCTGL